MMPGWCLTNTFRLLVLRPSAASFHYASNMGASQNRLTKEIVRRNRPAISQIP